MTSVILSSNEFYRLQRSTHGPGPHHASHLFQAKQSSSGKARAEAWPDTLEARNRKHEIDRLEQLRKEEEARQKIDAEEALDQLQRRQEAIERANVILYV